MRAREVIVIDTLSLVKAHAHNVELCPINSGATLRKAARRGLKTFSPLSKYTFNEWCKLRGRRDQIHEIIVRGQVSDIADHAVEVLLIEKEYR